MHSMAFICHVFHGKDSNNINDLQKKQHAAQRQFLRVLNYLNRESTKTQLVQPFLVSLLHFFPV